ITGADGVGCSRGAWTAPPPLAYLGQDRSKLRTRQRGGRAELCHASTAPGAVAHQGYQRHEHRDAGARSVLRGGACRNMDMDVVLVELRWIDPQRYGAALDDAERGLRA